jgi:hypothetical protein
LKGCRKLRELEIKNNRHENEKISGELEDLKKNFSNDIAE